MQKVDNYQQLIMQNTMADKIYLNILNKKTYSFVIYFWTISLKSMIKFLRQSERKIMKEEKSDEV